MFPAWSEKKSSKRKSEIYWKVNFRTLPQTLSFVAYMGVGKWGSNQDVRGASMVEAQQHGYHRYEAAPSKLKLTS